METILYIIDFIKIAWIPALIMGMIAMPLLWFLHRQNKKEWESLNKYYFYSSDPNHHPKKQFKYMYKIVLTRFLYSYNLRVSAFEKSGSTTKPFTIFRFKFTADIVCWFFNKTEHGFDKYTVHKITVCE